MGEAVGQLLSTVTRSVCAGICTVAFETMEQVIRDLTRTVVAREKINKYMYI